MKKLIFVLLLLPALIACNQEEICEKHEVTIELYDLVTDQVTAYDMELNTEVVIDYSKDVFKMSKMDLYCKSNNDMKKRSFLLFPLKFVGVIFWIAFVPREEWSECMPNWVKKFVEKRA